jgi:isoleucyl-tRNA synthetase
VDASTLEPLDRAALARVRQAFLRAREDYAAARFHAAVGRLVELCTTDLSAVYLDFRKDALYTLAADHPERRSAQAVLWETLRGLTVLMAPVLSFTAEEVWQHVPALKAEAASVLEATWGDAPAVDEKAAADWEALRALREAAYRGIETERAAKRLTKTNEAAVALGAGGAAERDLLARYAADLPTFLLASIVTPDGPPPPAGETWGVAVTRTPYARCERCWNYRDTVGQAAAYPELCDRCVAALPHDFVKPPA